MFRRIVTDIEEILWDTSLADQRRVAEKLRRYFADRAEVDADDPDVECRANEWLVNWIDR